MSDLQPAAVKFVALYRLPEKAADFDDAYFSTHLPLVDETPGLQRTEISWVTRMLRGEPALHLMAEMYFADTQSLRTALHSQEWAEAGENLAAIGGLELATMYTAEVVDADQSAAHLAAARTHARPTHEEAR